MCGRIAREAWVPLSKAFWLVMVMKDGLAVGVEGWVDT